MGVFVFLWSVARLVLRFSLSSFVHLCRRFSALVSWSLGFMVKREIRNSEMGPTKSMHEGDQRDFLTEYDSTWDDDDCPETPSSEFNIQWSRNAHRNTYAAKDMQNFRKTFRGVKCDDAAGDMCDLSPDFMPNLQFYQNEMESRPDGAFIEEFLKEWHGDYMRLEWVHSYIQWLFPIQEQGMNYASQPLTPEEIKLFRKDDSAKARLLRSYKLMLDFYGIKLLDEKTGKVCRAENWEERFKNLEKNSHNNLRITRILKCLGILGFERYQAPLVHFFLTETLVEKKLPGVRQSVLDYFMFSVLNTSERKKLIRFAFEKFDPKEEFVWCPKRIQRRFLKEIKTRKTKTPENSRDPSGSERCDSAEIQKQNKEASNASSAQNAENGESSGVGKADTNPNSMHNNQEDQEKKLSLNPDHTDTTIENQNTSDTDKGNKESEALLQSSINKSTITDNRGKEGEIPENEGSGSTGTDNPMDTGYSSEQPAQQSDEDKIKLHANHISDDQSKDEYLDLEITNLEQNCDPGATEESRQHNSTETSKHSGQVSF
ncbi:hypothetical protein AOLI_G00250900 [Acnodon oligacanthus]